MNILPYCATVDPGPVGLGWNVVVVSEPYAELAAVALDIARASSVEDACVCALYAARARAGSDTVELLRLDPQGVRLELFRRIGNASIGTGPWALVDTGLGRALLDRQALRIADTSQRGEPDLSHLAACGQRSTLMAPVLAGGRALGVLRLAARSPNRYTEADEGYVTVLACLLAPFSSC